VRLGKRPANLSSTTSTTPALADRRKASAGDSGDRENLERLLRERLRKFTSLLLKVLARP
jgi:hypothetical protein